MKKLTTLALAAALLTGTALTQGNRLKGIKRSVE